MTQPKITQAAVDASHLSVFNFSRNSEVLFKTLDEARNTTSITLVDIEKREVEITYILEAAASHIIAANPQKVWRKLSDEQPPVDRVKQLAFFISCEWAGGEITYGICCDEWFVTNYQYEGSGLCFGKNGVNLGDKFSTITHWAHRDELFPQPLEGCKA